MLILHTQGQQPTADASVAAMAVAGKKVVGSAIGLLIQDHQQVESWFTAYEKQTEPEVRRHLTRNICLALKVHTQVEEDLFYPAARDVLDDPSILDRSEKEHAEAKELITRIESGGDGADMDEMMRALKQAVQQHVAEEETELFPMLQETSLDFMELGLRMAGLRVALFVELTGGRPPRTDRNPSLEWNEPMSTISTDVAQSTFLNGLRDAHAMEKQSETMLSRQAERLENYPKVKERVQRHLEETKEQINRLDQILEGLGEDPSTFKDVSMKTSGAMGAMGQAGADDEILKSSLSSFAFEKFEEASYEMLLTIGVAAGQYDAVRLLQSSLSEERAMGNWLAMNAPGVTSMFLELRSQGQPAKH